MNYKHISMVLAIVLLTGCGSDSSSSNNDGKGDIDLSKYYPSESIIKRYNSIERHGDNLTTELDTEIIDVTGNTITTILNDDTEISEKTVFSDTNITTTLYDSEYGDEVNSIYRYVDVGDTLLVEKTKQTIDKSFGKITFDITNTCKILSKEDKFEKNDYIYSGDLLKIECIDEGEVIYDVKDDLIDLVSEDLNGSHEYYDKLYYYLKKDVGFVAMVDDDCISNSMLPDIIDDRKTECIEKEYQYDFYLP